MRRSLEDCCHGNPLVRLLTSILVGSVGQDTRRDHAGRLSLRIDPRETTRPGCRVLASFSLNLNTWPAFVAGLPALP